MFEQIFMPEQYNYNLNVQHVINLIFADPTFANAFFELTKIKSGHDVQKKTYKLNLFDPTQQKHFVVSCGAGLYINAIKGRKIFLFLNVLTFTLTFKFAYFCIM